MGASSIRSSLSLFSRLRIKKPFLDCFILLFKSVYEYLSCVLPPSGLFCANAWSIGLPLPSSSSSSPSPICLFLSRKRALMLRVCPPPLLLILLNPLLLSGLSGAKGSGLPNPPPPSPVSLLERWRKNLSGGNNQIIVQRTGLFLPTNRFLSPSNYLPPLLVPVPFS